MNDGNSEVEGEILDSIDGEEVEETEVFRNFDDEAQLITRSKTIPKKSGDRYLINYKVYQSWREEHLKSLS